MRGPLRVETERPQDCDLQTRTPQILPQPLHPSIYLSIFSSIHASIPPLPCMHAILISVTQMPPFWSVTFWRDSIYYSAPDHNVFASETNTVYWPPQPLYGCGKQDKEIENGSWGSNWHNYITGINLCCVMAQWGSRRRRSRSRN